MSVLAWIGEAKAAFFAWLPTENRAKRKKSGIAKEEIKNELITDKKHLQTEKSKSPTLTVGKPVEKKETSGSGKLIIYDRSNFLVINSDLK